MHLMPVNAGSVARIIGIDPGSESLGLSCIDYDLVTQQVVSSTAQTFVGSKMGMNEWMGEVHSNRFARIDAHYQNLMWVLQTMQPTFVVCETPFFNPRRPNAFEVLVEVLKMIRQALWDYDRHMRLETVDPPSVKKGVKAPGNADKAAMTVAVCRLEGLNYQGTVPLAQLDEHSIDALAVAWVKVNQLRSL